MKWKYFVAAATLLVLGAGSVKADGLLELRVGAGMNGTNPDDLNDAVGSSMDFSSMDNYNLDVFFNLPGPLGFGIRNEWLNTKESGGGIDGEIDVNNLTALVDLRLLDNTLFYVGGIGGVGYPWGKLKGFGGNDTDINSDSLNYTLGAEAGLRLSKFILGAELGYTNLRLQTDDGTTSVDLSGWYGKLMLGLSLF